MKLIADSGSTKTTWLIRRPSSTDIRVDSVGLNPVRDDAALIQQVVEGVAASLGSYLGGVAMESQHTGRDVVEEVYFYGAGCIAPYAEAVRSALESAFVGAKVAVESDLLGAARALFGVKEGVVCILGTGSNSCLYDGEKIVANVSPLGWILGDEGSGAVLGRTLVGDLLKGQLTEGLREAFLERFELTPTAIIDAVYRQPQANRFLASLVPFIVEHREDESIHALLLTSFRAFFRRNVSAYGRQDLPVGFVGGIAAQFERELREAAELEGFEVGRIEQHPILGMAAFHGA
ncbi:MAG: ATPase [Bacteroidaceae bacterium]|nr:ATPase [Bacteroidaceae bacterium]